MDFLKASALAVNFIHEREKHFLRASYRRGVRNVVRQQFDWDQHCEILGDQRFSRAYRMPREAFNRLLKEIEPHLLPEAQARDGRFIVGRPRVISSTCKLSMFLRYLAGGSYLDIGPMHFVHFSTFYKCLDEVMRAIDGRFRIEFPYNDEAALDSIASGFTRNGQSPITGCVGAVDGVAVRIKEPARNSVLNPSTYFNRKGFFSINVQALCDSQYRFLFFSSSSAGSTHDSTAFGLTRLAILLEGVA